MNRLRIVNGTYHDLLRNAGLLVNTDFSGIEPAMSQEEAARIAEAAMNQEVIGGCLSDPSGMMSDVLGRFTEVSESQMPKAKRLCKERLVDDGRFTIQGCPDNDLVIVIDTVPDKVVGADGETLTTERYLVFLRERGGNGEDLDIPPVCYVCNNAEKSKRVAKPHKCWRLRRPMANMVPTLYAKAHGIDDAEDLAKEMRSAWQADREQEEGTTDWGSQMEIPFSPDWQAGYLAGNPKAWNTLSAE